VICLVYIVYLFFFFFTVAAYMANKVVYIIAFLLLIHYAVTLTFDIEHLQCIACEVMKL